MRLVRLGTFLLAAAVTVPAAAIPSAMPIRYTISGTFTGSVGEAAFTDTPLTFTGIGNTGTFTEFGNFTLVPVAMTVTNPFGAGTLAVTDNEAFGVYRPDGNVFFSTDDSSGNPTYSFPVIADNPAFESYSGLTYVGPTSSNYSGAAAFDTASGSFAVTSGDNITFSATAVPEPAVWGLMIAGFGLVGVGQRGRRTGVVAD